MIMDDQVGQTARRGAFLFTRKVEEAYHEQKEKWYEKYLKWKNALPALAFFLMLDLLLGSQIAAIKAWFAVAKAKIIAFFIASLAAYPIAMPIILGVLGLLLVAIIVLYATQSHSNTEQLKEAFEQRLKDRGTEKYFHRIEPGPKARARIEAVKEISVSLDILYESIRNQSGINIAELSKLYRSDRGAFQDHVAYLEDFLSSTARIYLENDQFESVLTDQEEAELANLRIDYFDERGKKLVGILPDRKMIRGVENLGGIYDAEDRGNKSNYMNLLRPIQKKYENCEFVPSSQNTIGDDTLRPKEIITLMKLAINDYMFCRALQEDCVGEVLHTKDTGFNEEELSKTFQLLKLLSNSFKGEYPDRKHAFSKLFYNRRNLSFGERNELFVILNRIEGFMLPFMIDIKEGVSEKDLRKISDKMGSKYINTEADALNVIRCAKGMLAKPGNYVEPEHADELRAGAREVDQKLSDRRQYAKKMRDEDDDQDGEELHI